MEAITIWEEFSVTQGDTCESRSVKTTAEWAFTPSPTNYDIVSVKGSVRTQCGDQAICLFSVRRRSLVHADIGSVRPSNDFDNAGGNFNVEAARRVVQKRQLYVVDQPGLWRCAESACHLIEETSTAMGYVRDPGGIA